MLTDHQPARQWLEKQWIRVQEEHAAGKSLRTRADVNALVNSKTKSIRYAVITQTLGKIIDPARDCLALQSGSPVGPPDDSALLPWNARDFATAVIVPWSSNNHNLIHKSRDPYVNNPLRRPRLDDSTSVRPKAEWQALVHFLEAFQATTAARRAVIFRWILRSFYSRREHLNLNYPVPRQISQSELERLVQAYISKNSAGRRPQAVAAALFQILGREFHLYSSVEVQGINESDAASGAPGDIVCAHSVGGKQSVIEVKDQPLRLSHIDESLSKIASVQETFRYFFLAPSVRFTDLNSINQLFAEKWEEGLHVGILEWGSLLHMLAFCPSETARTDFMWRIGEALDEQQDDQDRQDWFNLLKSGISTSHDSSS